MSFVRRIALLLTFAILAVASTTALGHGASLWSGSVQGLATQEGGAARSPPEAASPCDEGSDSACGTVQVSGLSSSLPGAQSSAAH